MEKAALLIGYFILAIGLGVAPYERTTWALENSIPFLEGLAVLIYYRVRGVELTRLSLYLIFLHLGVQMIGGHYTYAKVPLFDWLQVQLGWARNHYDRVAHFAVGLCLFIPVREICLRRTPLRGSKPWAVFFTFATLCAVAGLWEVWEWLVAVLAYPDLGQAYLGIQGDPWDAQKDILMTPLGALAALLLFSSRHDATLEGLSPAVRFGPE